MDVIKIKKIINYSLSPFYFVFSLLLGLVPKNKKMLIFGAKGGKSYSDNSRHLFEFISNKRNDLQCYWITKSNTVYEEVKNKGFNVVKTNSLKSLIILSRARYGFYTNSLLDFTVNPFFMPMGIKLMNLKHGKSVKRVRFYRKKEKLSFFEFCYRTFENIYMKKVISTSELISEFQQKDFKIDISRNVITGYPRNDLLFAQPKKKSDKNIILYAPTWRHGKDKTIFFPFKDFSFKKLEEILKKTNFELWLRPHHNETLTIGDDKSDIETKIKNSNFIKIKNSNDFLDTNRLLSSVDVLISDYSSIYHDFLLLDRPVFLIPYDYDFFEKNFGFHYDYFKNAPGPIIETLKDFEKNLNIIKEKGDVMSRQRKKLKDKIHTYQDNKSRERLYNKLVELGWI
jgi:CDP-glycerol glycerophosphotransferase (TagB/SpsB family)